MLKTKKLEILLTLVFPTLKDILCIILFRKPQKDITKIDFVIEHILMRNPSVLYLSSSGLKIIQLTCSQI